MTYFSVIVPIYKVEKYLRECIESVLTQSYKNYELLLIDDGSPDNCPQICDEYQKQNKNVRVVHQENSGLSNARNTGLQISAGGI